MAASWVPSRSQARLTRSELDDAVSRSYAELPDVRSSAVHSQPPRARGVAMGHSASVGALPTRRPVRKAPPSYRERWPKGRSTAASEAASKPPDAEPSHPRAQESKELEAQARSQALVALERRRLARTNSSGAALLGNPTAATTRAVRVPSASAERAAVSAHKFNSALLMFESAFRELYARRGNEPVPNRDRALVSFEVLDLFFDRVCPSRELRELASSLRDELFSATFARGPSGDATPYFALTEQFKTEGAELARELERQRHRAVAAETTASRLCNVAAALRDAEERLFQHAKQLAVKEGELRRLQNNLRDSERNAAKWQAQFRQLKEGAEGSAAVQLMNLHHEEVDALQKRCARLQQQLLQLVDQNSALTQHISEMVAAGHGAGADAASAASAAAGSSRRSSRRQSGVDARRSSLRQSTGKERGDASVRRRTLLSLRGGDVKIGQEGQEQEREREHEQKRVEEDKLEAAGTHYEAAADAFGAEDKSGRASDEARYAATIAEVDETQEQSGDDEAADAAEDGNEKETSSAGGDDGESASQDTEAARDAALRDARRKELERLHQISSFLSLAGDAELPP